MTLGELVEIRVSNVDKKSRFGETSVRLCNYLDVYTNDELDNCRPYMVATATHAEIARFGLRVGDVVVTKDSETPDDIGRPAVILSAGPDLVCGYHLAILRPGVKLDSFWLAKQLRHDRAKKYFGNTATGSTRYGLSNGSIRDFPVWVPPRAEQERAGEILRTLDASIRTTEQAIAKLQQVKQGLLHDLLTRGIDDNGDLRDPERHPEQFKKGLASRVPTSWTVASLGSHLLGTPQNGMYKPAEFYGSGTPIVRIDGFYDGVLARMEGLQRLRTTPAERMTYALEPGNILINRVNSIDYVGKAALVPSFSEPVVFESNIMRLRLDVERLLPSFAIRRICASDARRHFHRRAKSAIAQASINQTDVGDLPIAVPPPHEQAEIAERLDAIDAHISAESNEYQKLQLLKQGLIDDLLTGRVRVKVSAEATA